MSAHTKGTWTLDQYGNVKVNGETVRAMGFALSGCKTSIANSRRIVACVNACEGVGDDAMYGGWTAAGMSAYTKNLEQQRDELLSALKDARATLDRANDDSEVIIDTIWHTPYETLFDFMDAAIEKASQP